MILFIKCHVSCVSLYHTDWQKHTPMIPSVCIFVRNLSWECRTDNNQLNHFCTKHTRIIVAADHNVLEKDVFREVSTKMLNTCFNHNFVIMVFACLYFANELIKYFNGVNACLKKMFKKINKTKLCTAVCMNYINHKTDFVLMFGLIILNPKCDKSAIYSIAYR